MDIQQAVITRKSVRDFLDTPVPEPVLRKVLDIALRAPSGGNLQPWHLHVVTGEALNRLKTLMQEKVSKGFNEVPEYQIYPPKLQSPYRDRRFEIGELMYSQLGMILQTIMLLLRGEGLDSCAQESWSVYPKTIGEFLNLPEGRKVFAGMAIGYTNPDSPVNQITAPRAAFNELVEFRRE